MIIFSVVFTLTQPVSCIILYQYANCPYWSSRIMKAFILGLLISSCALAQEFPLELLHEFELPAGGFDVRYWMNDSLPGWAVLRHDTIFYKTDLSQPMQTFVLPDSLPLDTTNCSHEETDWWQHCCWEHYGLHPIFWTRHPSSLSGGLGLFVLQFELGGWHVAEA